MMVVRVQAENVERKAVSKKRKEAGAGDGQEGGGAKRARPWWEEEQAHAYDDDDDVAYYREEVFPRCARFFLVHRQRCRASEVGSVPRSVRVASMALHACFQIPGRCQTHALNDALPDDTQQTP